MNIVAICECANGNSSIGSMWFETKVFDPSTPVSEIVSWAHNNNGGEGKLIISVDRKTKFQAYKGVIEMSINVLSLGVGVQSSCMALMACMGELERPDLIVFSDPGWETKRTYEYANWLKETVEGYGIPVIFTRNGNIREDLIRAATEGTRVASLPFFTLAADGTTGMVMRQCTDEYKIQGVRRAVKAHMGVKTAREIKDPITLWMGISTDEIERVASSRERWIVNRYPLIEKMMNRLDCSNWLERNGFPIPPKSSCIGCPFHSDETWLDMKKNDPDSWNDAVEVDRIIRRMPKVKNQVFLHRSCKPLDEVNLNEDQLSFEIDWFANECTGHCGV